MTPYEKWDQLISSDPQAARVAIGVAEAHHSIRNESVTPDEFFATAIAYHEAGMAGIRERVAA